MRTTQRLALLAASPALLLAACGRTTEVPRPTVTYALTVQASPTTSRADLERQYGGQVRVYAPDAGFAVLRVGAEAVQALKTQRGEHLTAQSATNVSLDEDTDTFSTGDDGVQTSGQGLWAGGQGLWAGGQGLWAGGQGLWAGGAITMTENQNAWTQVGLTDAQAEWETWGITKSVKVAVIDTGIDLKHPAFQGRLAPAGEMRDFVDGDLDPREEGVFGTGAVGHGTNVAGIILQVAPNAQILPIRALDERGYGDTSSVAAAIVHAANSGAHVINLSLGSSKHREAVSRAVRYATERGVYVVGAAGNENAPAAQYPARLSETDTRVIGVSSVDAQDVKSSFANYGGGTTLAAPGERIFAPAPGERQAAWSGTSQATPVAAGAVVLALGSDKLGHAVDLKRALENSATDVQALNTATFLGSGRLNVAQFLKSALTR